MWYFILQENLFEDNYILKFGERKIESDMEKVVFFETDEDLKKINMRRRF